MESGKKWSWEEDKKFETALVLFLSGPETPESWQKLAAAVGGDTTVDDVKCHYQKLVEDIDAIESGRVPLPDYDDDVSDNDDLSDDDKLALKKSSSQKKKALKKSGKNSKTRNKKGC